MIVVYGIRGKLNPIKAQLSDLIHGCMRSVLGMPEDKRAHRFIPMEREDFYFPGGRSDSYTVIEINMMAGRKIEIQKALIKSLFKEIECQLGYYCSRHRNCHQGASAASMGISWYHR